MTDLFLQLQANFPSLVQVSDIDGCVAQLLTKKAENHDNSGMSEEELNTDSEQELGMGGLFVMIQTDERTQKQQIWLRHMQSFSAYPIEDEEELFAIIDGVIHDDILWILEYQEDEWQGSTLIDIEDDIALATSDPNITYHIYSWSGEHDKVKVLD